MRFDNYSCLSGPGSSSGRASTLGLGGCGFETRPCHTKCVKNGTSGLVGSQHYKASTGFSSLTKIA